MMAVEILVNGEEVIRRTARRISLSVDKFSRPAPEEICTYRLDDGQFIQHVYGDGLVVLARKVLEAEEARKA